MADTSSHRFNTAPFTESDLYSLSFRENWPELSRILEPVAKPGFAVVDGYSQSLIDDARRLFDLCTGGEQQHKRNVLHWLAATTGSDAAAAWPMVEQLLSIGVDPDLGEADGSRPIHLCGKFGNLKTARAVLLCRVDMEARNAKGTTPGAAALVTYEDDGQFPERLPGRWEVWKFMENEGLEQAFKPLAELAARKVWFAVKNLVRRQVMSASEYNEKAYGKTAVEWAEHFGETKIAEELRHYASLPSAKLFEAQRKVEDLEKKLKNQESTINSLRKESTSKEAELKAEAAASDAKLKEKVKSLEERCAAYETKVSELTETVVSLMTRLPAAADAGGTSGETAADVPAGGKRPKRITCRKN